MNAQAKIAPHDGRHRFTRDEVARMALLDVFNGRVELLNGEIIDKPSEGVLHQDLRGWLVARLYGHMSGKTQDLRVETNGPLRLADEEEPEPDIYVRPSAKPLAAVRAEDVLLLIEICQTNTKRDFEVKPPIYAAHGIRDYWLIDLEARETIVRRGPRSDGSWIEQRTYLADEPIGALLIPGFAFRLADFGTAP
jgi:Uma2 family endonuclease